MPLGGKPSICSSNSDRPIAHGVEGTAGIQEFAQHQAQAIGERQLQMRVPGWNKLVGKLFDRFGKESRFWRQRILPEEDLTADSSYDIYTT